MTSSVEAVEDIVPLWVVLADRYAVEPRSGRTAFLDGDTYLAYAALAGCARKADDFDGISVVEGEV